MAVIMVALVKKERKKVIGVDIDCVAVGLM